MRLRLLPLVLLLAAGCAAVSGAPSEQRRAEAAWADLLALAAAPEASPSQFAPLVVALGDDRARRYRTSADASVPSEAESLAGVARELRGLLARVSADGRFGYRTVAFRTETESEGTWRALTVRFDDPPGTRVTAAFLPVDGRLLLGDID